MATIRELAAYVGYSTATISRVLNNDPTMSVSDATRMKILKAAKELNYTSGRPKSPAAPAPRHIAIAEMLSRTEQLRDPYYLYLKDYAVKHCVEQGHTVSFLYDMDGRYQESGKTPPDGILAIGIFSRQQIEMLQEICPCIVFLDSSPDEFHFDSVVLNFRLGIESAIDCLVEHGHRRIGFLGPVYKLDQLKRKAPETRRLCFMNKMKELGLYDEALVLDTRLSDADVRSAVHNWARTAPALPAAFISYNEEVAITAVNVWKEQGLRIPEDISIISFNDTPLSILVELPLTSINAHLSAMSETAVRLLTHRIADPDALPCKAVLPLTLTQRDSVSRLT